MAFVAAAMAVVGAASSLFGGMSAKDAAKKAADQQLYAEGLLTKSKLQTIDAEERQMKGQTIASAAGSGVTADKGSPLQLLAEQAKQFEQERFITAKVGASKSSQTISRGRMVGDSAMYQGISGAASSLSSAFSLFSQAKPSAPSGGGGGM